jgi:uncharacterized DUF497 family protein
MSRLRLSKGMEYLKKQATKVSIMDNEIEYDETKSRATAIARGFDFDYAARIFEGPVVEWESPRSNEERTLAVGKVEGRFLTVVYTWREGRRRIISARAARKAEKDVYNAQNP